VSVLAWPPRRWLVAAGIAVLTAVATGIPTDVIPNPLFGRDVPVTWWSYPVWAATAVLAGLVAATYVRDPVAPPRDQGARVAGVGGLLAFLAVGCPTCNKVAVLALGAGGATAYFGPAQPYLGVIGLLLLAGALVWRLRGLSACRVPPADGSRALRRS
jgi:hypothetical protein